MNTETVLNPTADVSGQKPTGRPGKYATRKPIIGVYILIIIVVMGVWYAFNHREKVVTSSKDDTAQTKYSDPYETARELADGFGRGVMPEAEAHMEPEGNSGPPPSPKEEIAFGEPTYVTEFKKRRVEKFLEAIDAPSTNMALTGLVPGLPGTDKAATGADGMRQLINQFQQRANGFGISEGGDALPGANLDQNMQYQKEAFLKNPLDADFVDSNVTLPAAARNVVSATQIIPAITVFEVNSDLPGKFRVQVSENVRDYRTGNHILIPQGTNIMFDYSSRVAFGQNRVAVKAERLIFPNGEHRLLGDSGFVGVDQKGTSGVKDKVNRHLLEIFGAGLILAVTSAGFESATNDDFRFKDDFGDEFTESTANIFGRIAEKFTEKSLNRQPTLEIRAGTRVNVYVTQDMIFNQPYQQDRG